MSKRLFAAVAGLAAVAAAAAPARAQLPSITPFSFEGRAGLALPTGDLGDLAGPGYTLGGSVTFHALPMIGIYGGYTYSRFDAEDELGDGHYTDSGVDLGARVGIPTPLIPIDPWIKGGVVFHKLSGEFEDDPDLTGETDTSFGFEVGAGLGFGLGPVSITPGVSMVRYTVDDEEESDDDATVSYIKADIGIRIRL